MPVAHTLVHDALEVNVLVVADFTLAVKLVLVVLCAEGDEYGQGAEIVDVVVDGRETQEPRSVMIMEPWNGLASRSP